MTSKISHLAASGLVLIILLCSGASAQPQGSQKVEADDPVLRAMQEELERSKSQLKLEGMPAPYYIEYRVTDFDSYSAEAAFGALRSNVRTRFRFLRVVVRVGDYKQDSFFGMGEGVGDILPLDNDELTLRHQLWLATDRAYKAAAATLTAKKAMLKQYAVENPVDDFAHTQPVVYLGPLATLEFDPQVWPRMLQDLSALYKADPEIQSASSSLNFQATNRFFVNSEGSEVRSGQTAYQVIVAGTTQASDGMQLSRDTAFTVDNLGEMPSREEIVAQAKKLLGTLKAKREAPLADEEYRGPVLFSADAASTVLADMVGENILGLRPGLGQAARTTGAFASSFKARVLPDFLSVVDDPTLASTAGKPLLGHYAVDDEGVKAMRVPVIEKGMLVNYLIGRQPIRDFPASNGHGRARVPGVSPGPSLGNMIVTSSDPVSNEELRKKLLEICRQRDLPYGYYVEAMGPGDVPRMMYKVWVKDGHEELVRGTVFGDLDTRSLRSDLVAAGGDVNVENRLINVPHSIVNPSILFDEWK